MRSPDSDLSLVEAEGTDGLEGVVQLHLDAGVSPDKRRLYQALQEKGAGAGAGGGVEAPRGCIGKGFLN